MFKMAKRTIKNLVTVNAAVDITRKWRPEDVKALQKKEGGLTEIGYANGIYGLSGVLLKGNSTGTLYAITDNTPALYAYNF